MNQIASLNEKELLIILGAEILSQQQAFLGNHHEDSFIKVAENWLKDRFVDFKKKLCSNGEIKSITKSSNDLELISAVADLISGVCLGISPFTVATILVKRGLKKLCSE